VRGVVRKKSNGHSATNGGTLGRLFVAMSAHNRRRAQSVAAVTTIRRYYDTMRAFPIAALLFAASLPAVPGCRPIVQPALARGRGDVSLPILVGRRSRRSYIPSSRNRDRARVMTP
jgi:hypothetical protein